MSKTHRHGTAAGRIDYTRSDIANPWRSTTRNGAKMRRDAKRAQHRAIRRDSDPRSVARHSIGYMAYAY